MDPELEADSRSILEYRDKSDLFFKLEQSLAATLLTSEGASSSE